MKQGSSVIVLLVLSIILLTPEAVQAAPAASFLPLSAKSEPLPESGLRATSTGRAAAATIMPVHPAAAALRSALSEEGPDVIVEALFAWAKPATGGSAPGAAELLALYNIFRSVGSLEGIEYWSASRNTMRLFYEISYLTGGPDSSARIEDSVLTTLPAQKETLYARQKDLSFGDNRYRIELQAGSDSIIMTSTNLTTLRYGILPVASPGQLNVRVLAINADDAVLFYAVSSAKAAVVPGVRGKLESSFGNRAAALYAWFSRKAITLWSSRI